MRGVPNKGILARPLNAFEQNRHLLTEQVRVRDLLEDAGRGA